MTRRLSLLLEIAMAVLGLVIVGTGVLGLVVRVEQRAGLSVIVVCLGLTISGVAGYAVYLERTGVDFLFAAPKAVQAGIVHHVNESSGPVVLTRFASSSTSDNEVSNLCLSRMSADDLHFVGYYVDGIRGPGQTSAHRHGSAIGDHRRR